jgi:penicillin-binding protein 1A
MITTTVNAAMQEAARTTIVNTMGKRAESVHAGQAALVAMSPDGAIRALVGGKDYASSPFNRITQAHRAPGSAFKPFVYLTALERGLNRGTIRVDEPITIKDWSPDNYTPGNVGPVTLEYALSRSINTVAVELGQEVGLRSVIATARRLGIRSHLEPNASLALGTSEVTPLEMTAAYASFASVGLQAVPYSVTEIRAANGAILFGRAPVRRPRVIAPEDALEMNAMLYEVVQSGTGRGAAIFGREVAGKTGTSAEYRDAWFFGFSPELVTGVWVGNDDSTPMKKVTGGSLPAQIWGGFMRTALKNTPSSTLPRAEPLAGPLIAEGESPQGGGLLDRVGGFFQRLFGERRETPPNANDERERSSSQPQNSYRPDQPRYDYGRDNPYRSGGYAYPPGNGYGRYYPPRYGYRP